MKDNFYQKKEHSGKSARFSFCCWAAFLSTPIVFRQNVQTQPIAAMSANLHHLPMKFYRIFLSHTTSLRPTWNIKWKKKKIDTKLWLQQCGMHNRFLLLWTEQIKHFAERVGLVLSCWLCHFTLPPNQFRLGSLLVSGDGFDNVLRLFHLLGQHQPSNTAYERRKVVAISRRHSINRPYA